MNAHRLNQIAMAVLGALLLFFATKTIVNIAFEEREPEKPGYVVEGTKQSAKPGEAAKAAGEAKPAGVDLTVLLAKADAGRGAEVAKKCQLCHNLDKGGPNVIGPNLYGVLGRDVASHEGFDYSPALKAKGGKWDYVSIDALITNPAVYVPGTKMALFPGLPDAKQRADVLIFLRTKNDNPPPLPEAPAGGGAAPAAAPAASPEGNATPAAPKAEEPAPSAETPPAPATEEKPAETPAAPKAEEPAPSAETPPAPATEEKPAETPAAPKAEEPAPSAETPPAPAAEEKKPAESAPAPATPGEQPSSAAPQETPQ
jgi:cytochrome c